MNILDLNNKKGRRAGLREKDYKAPHLLKSINANTSRPGSKHSSNRSSPSIGRIDSNLDDSFEDFNRPPEWSSDDEDDARRAADIKPSIPKQKPKEKKSTGKTVYRAGKIVRIPNNKVSPASSPGTSDLPNTPRLGNSKTDEFGRLKASGVKKKFGNNVRPGIGPLPKRTFSNNIKSSNGVAAKKKKTSESRFKAPDIRDTEDEDDDERKAKKFKPSSYDDSGEEEEKVPGFNAPSPLKEKSPSTSPDLRTKKKFKKTRPVSPSDSEKEEIEGPGFQAPAMDLTDDENSRPEPDEEEEKPSPSLAAKVKHYTDIANAQPSQNPTFKTYSFDDSLLDDVNEALADMPRKDILQPISSTDLRTNARQEEEDNDTPRCPMCKHSITAEEQKKCLTMNTRQQEKFCRRHRKRDAEDVWFTKGYPSIDWATLDSRLAQHHTYLQTLLNGTNSHYRESFQEAVSAGKDRNLLKMTRNLTPGYYGTRGLRAISENIMQNFSPLLKKRAVKDRLIAARGVTGFVQAVLVPEVTVLLIMEDMNIGVEDARTVMSESAGIGELVNDEIRDVVLRAPDDEGDENEEGYH
ncbi:RTC4-like domain-containing protein [Xylogone sp. PMI_703]|nr:RTC4-like domain-containing protein [Xylogone sp. PMI_703]